MRRYFGTDRFSGADKRVANAGCQFYMIAEYLDRRNADPKPYVRTIDLLIWISILIISSRW